MPTVEQRGNKFRYSICKKGIRKSQTFTSKTEGKLWAARAEAEIESGYRGEIPNKKFSDLLDRYEEEVSIHKKGYRWESIRIVTFKRDSLAKIGLRVLSKAHISDWVSRRLLEVSSATVKRELNILSNVCSHACDWGWLTSNPCSNLKRRPKAGKARTRILLPGEWEKLETAAKTDFEKKVLLAASWALETGMRAGEIVALEKQHINGDIALIVDSKNGDSREVPLSTKAQQIVAPLLDIEGPIFGLENGTRDTLWRKVRDAAGVEDLNFHDLRHTAAMELSKILNPFQLCRMFGWKDLKMAMVYYNETAVDVAKLLKTSQSPHLRLVVAG